MRRIEAPGLKFRRMPFTLSRPPTIFWAEMGLGGNDLFEKAELELNRSTQRATVDFEDSKDPDWVEKVRTAKKCFHKWIDEDDAEYCEQCNENGRRKTRSLAQDLY